jgi:hypothetical protein
VVVETNAADPAIFAKLRREILFVIYDLQLKNLRVASTDYADYADSFAK